MKSASLIIKITENAVKSTSFKVNQQWNSARNDNFFLLAQLGPNAFWHPLSAESRVRHGD